MNLFMNSSLISNQYPDCNTSFVCETIQIDCFSVLHKLHDQVNGPQLVQVVIQPLARLFNPTVINQANSPINVTVNPSNQHGYSNNSGQTPTISQHSSFSSQPGTITSSQSINTASSTYLMSPDTAQALIARLDTDRDVNWIMEIVGYGLSMPFSSELDSVKDCCTIYLEWLSTALIPFANQNSHHSKANQLPKLVPSPIRNDPNRYARKMISHLYNVFLPRPSNNINVSSNTTSGAANSQKDSAFSRQAMLCHRVLRVFQNIALNPDNLMDNETWIHLLALLLTVNNKLLAQPTQADIGTELQDRTLCVLFDLILLASCRSVQIPNIWGTFHKMCLDWRHRPALIDHWKRITIMLTKKLIRLPNSNLIGSRDSMLVNRSSIINADNPNYTEALENAISSLSLDNLSQTWYMFLNLIGNPVDLTDPNIISKTNEFSEYATTSKNIVHPSQHPCLNVLPSMFMNSISALRDFVEILLGTYDSELDENSTDSNTADRVQIHRKSISSSSGTITPTTTYSNKALALQTQQQQTPQAHTPIQPRKVIKSITMKGSRVNPFSSPQQYSVDQNSTQQASNQSIDVRASIPTLNLYRSINQSNFKLSPDRPRINSILHVFGDWLFSAALIGSDLRKGIDSDENKQNTTQDTDNADYQSFSNDTSISIGRKSSQSKINFPLLSTNSKHDLDHAKNQEKNVKLDKTELCPDHFELGQAEAITTLCRIFSSKTSSEDISPNYLSRFYLCLQHCLTIKSDQSQAIHKQTSDAESLTKTHLLASVLINSTHLLQKDLDGINILIPSFISAIEYFFECSDRETTVQPPPRANSRSGSIRSYATNTSNLANSDLRRASIQTLMNLLAYPYHFQDLPIRNCLNESSPTTTFGSLRPRLIKLLFIALQTESDPTNMQILFGGLSLAIYDLASNLTKTSKEEANRNTKTKSETIPSPGESLQSETGSLIKQDECSSQSSFIGSSKIAFLVKSIHVTCNLLINVWKYDTQVSLAALDLLTTIARVTGLPEVNDFSEITNKSSTRLFVNNNNIVEMRFEYQQATKWICDYICSQCSRPPPAHSRDMHSTIVAAYQCLSIWFYNHPYLLENLECVNTVMEVIELGVSGQKSRSSGLDTTSGKETFNSITKGDKILKPSSMRVKEAAEFLLNICMVRPRVSLTDVIEPLYDNGFDETSICDVFSNTFSMDALRQSYELDTYRCFKYFSDEDSVIYGFFENVTATDPEMRDAVICLLRTPFGRYCCKFVFDCKSEITKESSLANRTIGLVKRPFQQCNTPNADNRMFQYSIVRQARPLYFNNEARFFPETIDSIEKNHLDQLIDTVDDYFQKSQKYGNNLKVDLDKMSKLFLHQVLAEQNVMKDSNSMLPMNDSILEYEKPAEFSPTRMLITQLGLGTYLAGVDKMSLEFVRELQSLDEQPIKIRDSATIFYVRKGRTLPWEILESVKERRFVSLEFFEWLLELGQPIPIKPENQTNSKYRAQYNKTGSLSAGSIPQLLMSDHGGSIFDGIRMRLDWSDICQELSFIVPHRIEKQIGRLSSIDGEVMCDSSEQAYITKVHDSHSSDAQSLCSINSEASTHSTKTLSQYSSSKRITNHATTASIAGSINERSEKDSISLHKQTRIKGNQTPGSNDCDTNIIICWLESADDINQINMETMLQISDRKYLLDTDRCHFPSNAPRSQSDSDYTSAIEKETPIQKQDQSLRSRDSAQYFITPMKNGLFRVDLKLSFGRQKLALPLVDGMTVGQQALSSLIRESILNLCRRRRLDADSYQPPHVRRRHKIQKICNMYKISTRHNPSLFYDNLFKIRTFGSERT